MEQIPRGIHSSYSAIYLLFSLVVVLPAWAQLQDTTGTTAGPPTSDVWTPRTVQTNPLAPVNYKFSGEDIICLVLSTTTTAVVHANSSNASLVITVNLQQGVPIDLVQTIDSCEQNTGLTCISLIIATNSDNLPEGEFQAFYDGKVTRITYGPLGLINPSGSDIIPFSPFNTTFEFLYRSEMMNREEFTVCNDGSFADFLVTVLRQPQCRLGSGAGGFSIPFKLTVVYIGFVPISGRDFIITSGSCGDPQTGNTISFTVPDHPTTPTPTPSVTPTTAVSTPSSSINVTTMATPPAPASPIATIVGVAAAAVAFIIFGSIVIIICLVIFFKKKRKNYKVESPAGPGEAESAACKVVNHENASTPVSNGDAQPHAHPPCEVENDDENKNPSEELDDAQASLPSQSEKSEYKTPDSDHPTRKSSVQPKTAPVQRKGNPDPENLNAGARMEKNDCHGGLDRRPNSRNKQRPDRSSTGSDPVMRKLVEMEQNNQQRDKKMHNKLDMIFTENQSREEIPEQDLDSELTERHVEDDMCQPMKNTTSIPRTTGKPAFPCLTPR